MMVNELASVEALPPHDASNEKCPESRERSAAVAVRLRAAKRLLPDDPDASALLMDGLLREIAWLWCAHAGLLQSASDIEPASIERRDQVFCWRLRLALCAPDVHARLAHCAALYELLQARAAAAGNSE